MLEFIDVHMTLIVRGKRTKKLIVKCLHESYTAWLRHPTAFPHHISPLLQPLVERILSSLPAKYINN
jgi:hypothetical protein